MRMLLSGRNLHDPVIRLRGNQLITKRGRWGENRQLWLLLRAGMKHGQITPCSDLTWAQSYTKYDGELKFWYNTSDGSTHIVKEERYVCAY